MPELLPLFLNLAARQVLLVGGGSVATGKLRQLLAAGANVRVIAPQITQEIREASVGVAVREFEASDLDEVWLVVAAATPEVNRAVADAANRRRIFVNAVDDPRHASAFMGGVLRRGDLTLAVSTAGRAPALASMVREALDVMVHADIAEWVRVAERERADWRARNVPIDGRKPLLLEALNRVYERDEESAGHDG